MILNVGESICFKFSTAISANNIDALARVNNINYGDEYSDDGELIKLYTNNTTRSVVVQNIFISNVDTVTHAIEVINLSEGKELRLYYANLEQDKQLQYTENQGFSVVSGAGGGGGTTDVNIVGQTITVDVDVTNAVEIDDSTPIDVAITGQPISVSEIKNNIDGRIQVSNLVAQFESQFEYDKQTPAYWGESGNSGGGVATHLPNESSVSMSTGDGTTGSRCRRRTHTWFRYQPGNPTRLLESFTFADATGKANLKQQVGYYDDNDGVYVQRSGTSTNLVLRSNVTGSVVNNSVAQASWNLDTLDGNGASGINIDWTKSQLMIIDFLSLHVGPVQVSFLTSDGIVAAHRFTNVNIRGTAYWSNPNLPLTYEIFNDGAVSGASVMRQICCAVFTEGGAPFTTLRGNLRGDSVDSSVTTGTTEEILLGIRPKTTYNSITNRGQILPVNIEFGVGDNEDCIFRVYVGTGIITSGTWTSYGTDSIAEVNKPGGGTGFTVTNASKIIQKFALAQTLNAGQISVDFSKSPVVLAEDGSTPFELAITAENTTGGNADAIVSVNWKEYS